MQLTQGECNLFTVSSYIFVFGATMTFSALVPRENTRNVKTVCRLIR